MSRTSQMQLAGKQLLFKRLTKPVTDVNQLHRIEATRITAISFGVKESEIAIGIVDKELCKTMCANDVPPPSAVPVIPEVAPKAEAPKPKKPGLRIVK